MIKRFITIVFLFIVISGTAQKNIYAPTLNIPANKAADQHTDVILLWNAVSNAYYYKLQLDTIVPTTDKNELKITNATSYTGRSLVFGKTYYWRVKSLNLDFNTGKTTDSSEWSETFSFKVINTVYLNLPANNATTQKTPVTISWNAISGVTGYDYSVDITPYFNSKYIISGSISNPNGVPASKYILNNLITGTTYYWRVRANNKYGQTNWSETRVFSTILNITDAPELFAPLSNTTGLPPSVNLRWNPLQSGNLSAKGYSYQVDETPEFTNPKAGNVSVTNKVVSKLLFGHKYFWRIKGYSDNNTSSWSDIYNFTIFNYPAGITPENGAKNQDLKGLKFYVDPAIAGVDTFDYMIDTTAAFNSKYLQTKKVTALNTTFPVDFKPAMVYYWRVRARLILDKTPLDTSDWSPIYTFTTTDGHLLSPVLLTPAINSVNQPINPRLSWNIVTGATAYKVQIDTLSDFSTPLLKSTTSAILDLSQGIKYGRTYFWRVKAFKAKTDSSAWSDVFSFSVIGKFPQKPMLYLPVNTAMYQMPDVTLLWSQTIPANTGDVVKYIYQLDLNGDFVSPLKSDTINEYKKTLSELSFFGKYYWRVRVSNNGILSDWSDVHSFTVIEFPYLSSPVDSANNMQLKSLILNWHKISGIIKYEFQLDVNDKFTNPLIKSYPTDSFYVAGNLNFSAAYYWRVRAIHSKDTSDWSGIRVLYTYNKVTIFTPENNSANIESDVKLSFSPLTGATEYYYQLDTQNPPFTGNIKNDSTYGLSNFVLSNLEFGKTYFLRVRAKNNYSLSQWSDTITFTTINKPVLLTPADKAVNQTPDVKIGWQNVRGALLYNFEVDINSAFNINSPTLINKNIFDNLQSPDTLLFGTKYYWHVQVQNQQSKSAYSDVWTFTTIDTVSVLSPNDASVITSSRDVNFKWTKISGVKNYELQMSQIIDDFRSATDYLISPTVDNYTVKSIKNGNWWWRLRAKTSSDTTQWSIIRSLNMNVGIENIENLVANIDIYPVPCKDKCSLRFDNIKANNNITVDLLNILGQSLFTSNFTISSTGSFTRDINLDNVENGIYFVRLTSGNSSVTRKIVVEK